MLSRRNFLIGLATAATALPLGGKAIAQAGTINAVSAGLRPGSIDDQGRKLQAILDEASKLGRAVFLEPGIYRVSNIHLPKFTSLHGVSGSTRLEYAGGNHFLHGENARHIILDGLAMQGGLLPIDGYAESLLRISNTKHVAIEKCHIADSAEIGCYISGSQGSLFNSQIENAIGTAGLYCVDNTGFAIHNNLVEECGNNGILVHRSSIGDDNTVVTGNRIRRIAALNGGTGPWGNGINTYRANGVIVNNNHVSDCAFSTIRSNSCSNIQIANNTCIRAGETSIYSEFAFQGASITGNIVDTAALGISIANFNEGGRLSTCSNNVIRNMHSHIPYPNDGHIHGVGISAEADTAITGNVIENTPRFGMMLGWGPYLRNVTATGNMIRKTQTGVAVSVVEGVKRITIANNIFSDVSTGAIVGHRWHDPVTGDLALANSSRFPELRVSGNTV